MPKALEEALKRKAAEKGFGKKRTGAYVYGTMNKLGLMHGNKVVKTPHQEMKAMGKE